MSDPPNTRLFDSPFVCNLDYGLVSEIQDFADKWGADTSHWPYSAVPMYQLVIGTYILGDGAGLPHVMYTLDRSGTFRVPVDSQFGQSSWVAWHEAHP